ncbi:DNA-binding response regulator [Spirochaetia bacterium]|nr:DNA-binding response regulator [Spirochaetia bacterium]
MIRIVIIDSQDQDRKNSELVLSAQSDFTVVGMGKDGFDAIHLVSVHKPDILLMEADLAGSSGLQTAAISKCRFPQTAAIILTNLNDDTVALDAIGNDVSGYLLKARDMERLAVVIRIVHAGGCCLSPSIAAQVFPMVSRLTHGECPVTPTLYPLAYMSKTELQIIHHVGGGLENQEIAEKLHLTTGTIRNYVSEILRKTSLRNRAQLAVFAEQNGLIQPSPKIPAA